MKRALSPTLGALLAIALLAPPAATAASPAPAPSPAAPESLAPAADEPDLQSALPAGAPTSQAPVVSLAEGVVTSGAASTGPLRFAELPNLHRVDDKLWRGGEPKRGGIVRLRELGVDTVLDLRWERGKMRREEAEAKAAGLRYFAIPMYGLVRPKEEQIAKALAIIADPANGRVFVHCERGSDRTGVVAACYRVAAMKWSAEDAIDEAMNLGMYRTERAKRTYIKDFSARIGN